jgi:pectate lyase
MMTLQKRTRVGVLVTAAAVLTATAMTFTPAASASTLFIDDFADGNTAGWTASGGSWTATDGLLRQSGTSSDARSRAGDTGWTDYTVSVTVKPTTFNGVNRFVAVLARAQSATSYYYLAARSNNTLELKRLDNGTATTLASAPLSVGTGRTYRLSLQVSGSALTGAVDGRTAVTATDTRYRAGQVGVATYYASADFDDVTVETEATPSPTPSATTSSPQPSPTVTPTPAPSSPGSGQSPIGFASVNALGLNGTTGGAGGRTITVTDTDSFLAAIDNTETLVIRVAGTITISSKRGVRPNKTIIGVGTTGHIDGGGLDFYRSYNVIVRNILFTNADDDAVNIGQESHHIWIDHNTFRGAVDGSVDIVRGSDYVTVSWNHFDHSDKSMLIGHSDGAASTDVGHLKVSVHHNYFDHSRQRHPRVRFGEPVHVYNNYFFGNDLYAVASVMNAGVVVEGNYFRDVPYPIYSTSGYADSGPGRAVERNNIYVNSGTPETNGVVVEPRTYYPYSVDSPASVPASVSAGAGYGKI